uniref:Ig-like domain-containing protein n=1 Tax=Moschus moschiferus TaxID=68415 RepID=A0A8C6CMA2_MOSMO
MTLLPGDKLAALTGVSVSLDLGSAFGALLSQKPSRAICQRGTSVTIECQVDSQLTMMYWYRQLPGQSLVLMATANQGSKATYESGFTEDKFPISRPNLAFSTLTVSNTSSEDTAGFCAGLGGRDSETQYFGPGTRLLVLDDLSQVHLPKVAVFEPSEAEISQTQKATLVCLATGFYPDHVELTWWVNRKQVTTGVSTDPDFDSALEDSVSHPFPSPFFLSDCGVTSASYQQGVLSATLLYEILLGKATLYAVLVSALVLMAMVKRKDS